MGIRVPVTNSTPKNTAAEALDEIPTPRSLNDITPAPVEEDIGGEGRMPASKSLIPDDVFDEVTNPIAPSIPSPTSSISQEGLDEVLGPKIEKLDGLYNARVISRSVDKKQTQNVLDVAEKLKINNDAAASLLSTTPLDELKTRPELANIEKDYPGVSTWARNPDNYAVLKQDPRWAKSAEDHSSIIGFTQDTGRVLAHNYYAMKQMAMYELVAKGLISKEKAISTMEGIQGDIDNNPIIQYEKDAEFLTKSGQVMGSKVTAATEAVMANRKAYYGDKENWFQMTKNELKLLPSVGEAALGFLDYLADMAKNPGASLLLAGKGASVIVPGAAAGAAGLALGGPIGAASAAYPASFVALHAMKMGEYAEQYRDEKTGKIDFTRMFSDKKAMDEMNAQANKYAGTHAVWDAISSATAGKLVTGVVTEIKTAGKVMSGVSKAAKVTSAFAVETASHAAMGGVGETTARLAIGESPAEAITKGLEVSAISLPIAGAKVAGSTIIRLAKEGTRAAVLKLSDVKKDSVDAVQNAQAIKNMREGKNTSEVPGQFPQQAQELVKNSPVKETTLVETDTPHDQMQRPNFLEFNVRQFEAVAEQLGRKPIEIATELGETALEAYSSAKANESTQFRLGYDEYYRYSDNLPELDDIVYANASKTNHVDAVDAFKELYEIEKHLFGENKDLPDSNSLDNGTEPPPITEGMIDEQVHYPTGEPQEGDPVLRPIELLQIGRNNEEKKVFRDLKNAITRTTKAAGIDPRMADLMAELQFRNTRFRAEQLGIPLTDIAEQTKVGFQKSIKSSSEGSIAYFRPGNKEGGVPRNSVIFGPKVKANTVIHEFAHSWLHNMANDWRIMESIETKTPNQQEYFDAMNAASKLLGVKNIGDLLIMGDTPQYHKIHETWAQTAEKYFLEGDFKQSKIRAVFESMRKWMASVASIVGKAYPQFPALKISPEVSRVFQTILEGNSKVEENMGRMFPEPLFSPELMGEKSEEYINAIKDSRDQAIGQMYSKFYTRSEKERETLINKSLNEIYDQAAKQVEELKSIKLMRDIHAGGEEARITHQSILEVLAKGDEAKMKEIQNNSANKIIAGKKKNGIDVRDIMQYIKIHDPEEMINILREMSERDSMVEDTASGIVDERFPLMKTDDQIHTEAVDAINNAGREKVLSLELEALSNSHLKTLQKMSATVALPPQMMARKSVEVIKKQGIDMVLNARAIDLRPNDYQNAAARHGKRAADFLSKGDYENAFWEKQQEAVNYQAYRRAQSEYVQVNKTTKNIRRFKSEVGPNMPRVLDADYHQYGQLLIRALEGNKTLPDIDVQGFNNSAILDQSRTDAINHKILAINEALANKNSKDISVQAYGAFGELLSMIRQTAKTARTVELENFNMDIEVAGALTSLEIGPRKTNDPSTSMNKGFFSRWSSGLINIRNLMSGLMSEEKFAKSNISKLLQSAMDAEVKFIAEKNIDEQKLSRLVSDITKDNPEMQSILSAVSKRFTQFTRGETGKPIAAKEINFTFNNEGELHQFMLYLGSGSGREKLAMGGLRSKDGTKTGKLGALHPETGELVTPAVDKMVARMIEDGTLKKEHFDFYQAIWDMYEKHYQPSKDAIRKVYGYEIGKIEARVFETPFGSYKGGYVPTAKDRAYMDATTSIADFATDQSGTSVRELFPVANTSFGKERTEAYYPMSLDLSSLRSRLNSVYRAAYLMPTMFEVGKVLDTPDFRSALESRRPGAMKAVVEPWFQRTMAQQYSDASKTAEGKAMDSVFRAIRSNARIVSFLGNYITVGKQFLGGIPALSVIDGRHLMSATAEVGLRAGETIRRISESSPRMKQRFDDNARRAVRSFEDFTLHMDKIDKIDEFIEKMTYAPIQWAQNHVDAIVFTAAADQAVSKFKMKNEKEIYGYAADVVERTQHTSNISSRQGIMNGSEAKRLFTDFSTYPLTMYGLNKEAFNRNVDAKTLKRAQVQLYTLLLVSAIPATMGLMLSHPGKLVKSLGDSEDAEKYFKDMALAAGSELVDVNFPVAGRNILSLFGRGDQAGVAPALRTIKTVGKAASAGTKATFGDKELTARDIGNMLDSITITTGIPLSVLNRGFKTLLEINPELDQKQ